VITTYQDVDGYSPDNIVIYAGYPTQWTVESSTAASCAASLWIPGLDIRERLYEGPNSLELPPLRAGTVTYTCAMGMYSARITVVDAPADALASGAAASVQPDPTTAPAAAEDGFGPWSADETATTAPAASAASTAGPSPTPAATPPGQVLRTWQDESGYGPTVARITAGVATTWTIESRAQASCAAYLVVPSLGIEKILDPGDNVIDLPALESGILQYTCGMGMFSGAILIEDAQPAPAEG
jgi:plastocyanin domain-containing protein